MLKNRNSMLTKGIFAVAFVAVVGVVGGVSHAQSVNANKPTKQECAAKNYANYGLCVADWAKNKSGGYGYGAAVAPRNQ